MPYEEHVRISSVSSSIVIDCVGFREAFSVRFFNKVPQRRRESFFDRLRRARDSMNPRCFAKNDKKRFSESTIVNKNPVSPNDDY